MRSLTRIQRDVMLFVQGYLAEHLVAPTHDEIRQRFGWSSFGTVSKHLRLLAKKGYLRHERGEPRGLEVVVRVESAATRVFRYGPGGSLVTDEALEPRAGVRHLEPESARDYYGGSYLVAESMTRETAAHLARLLGGRLVEDE